MGPRPPSAALESHTFIGRSPISWCKPRVRITSFTLYVFVQLQKVTFDYTQFAPLSPLAEQTRIMAGVERRLSAVEGLDALVKTNLQRATRLRQSILQHAFTGSVD